MENIVQFEEFIIEIPYSKQTEYCKENSTLNLWSRAISAQLRSFRIPESTGVDFWRKDYNNRETERRRRILPTLKVNWVIAD